MAAAKKRPRRKTVSAKEKAEIVKFALRHNKLHGKGGMTAAARQYGVSLGAVSGWMSAFRIAQGKDAWLAAHGVIGRGRSRKIAEMAILHAEILQQRKKLASLEARFEKLRDSL